MLALMRILIVVFLCLIAGLGEGFSQCQVYDGQGNATNTPVWISCSGGAYTLFVQSPNTMGPLIIDWGDGSPNTPVASLVPPAFVSHNYAAAIANYTVTITETSSGCVITGTVVMEEPVNASIQIPIGGVTQTCAPADLSFTNSSTDVSINTTFIWDFGDGTPVQTFDETNAGQTVTHNYAVGTVNCVTQVTLSAENYCSFGNPTVASFNPVQIYDIDDAQVSANMTLLCYPDTVVHFANTTNKNCVPQGNVAQRFEYWNFGNYWGTGTDSIIDWQPYDPPARPGYDIAFPGIGTYTVTMLDSNMCGVDAAAITVQVVDAPVAGITASTDSACTGEVVTFTNTSSGGNQHRINYGTGGGFVGMGATSTRVYNTPGTYTVRLVSNITGGSASCTDTASVVIVILPSPNATFSINTTGGCDSTVASFVNTSSGGSIYYWDFGNGDTSSLQNPPPITYTALGQTTVSLTVTSSNSCSATATSTVSVYDIPNVDFIAQNVCEDVQATFLDNSTVGYGGPVNSWAWSFGDPLNSTSPAQNPVFTYVDSGVYVVQLIASTSFCTDSISDTILVEPRPGALFAESDSVGCSPLSVTFTNQSTNAVSYIWYFGDGATSVMDNPAHTYVHNGSTDTVLIVKLVAISAFGCRDSITDTIVVQGNPVADFSSNAVLDCAPLEVQFTDLSTGAVAWQWAFGDGNGSVLQHPSYDFQNQSLFITNYTVTLTAVASNGCTDSAFQTITVYPEPLFSFSIVPDSGCSPLEVQFPVAVGAVAYSWDFGDGGASTSPNPSHTYVNTTTNNQTFNIQLIATSPFGCIDTTTGFVTIFPKPTAAMTPPVAQGCQPLTVNFINASVGGSVYSWDFGDGSTLTSGNTSVSHVFLNNTSDTLTRTTVLIATTDKGCMDTAMSTIRVFRPVEASFTSPVAGCHPLTVPFTDLSTNAAFWAWNFGDGNTSTQQHPTHVFQNLGIAPVTYNAELTVQTVEGCTDDTTVQIIVNHKPNAQILPLTVSGCQPLTVNFSNISTGGDSHLWDFGDGDSLVSNNAAVPHVFYNNTNDTLNFNTVLIASTDEGCLDTASSLVSVFRRVNASFIAPVVTGCHPFSVAFTDQSTNPAFWAWSFGDGNTSTQQHPTHVFQNFGIAPVNFTTQLSVQTVEGCADDTTVQITVNHKPNAQILPLTQSGCQPLTVNFANNSSGGNTYFWNFGDGGTSTTSGSISHVFGNGTNDTLFFTPTLEVTTVQGCKDTASASITVYRRIHASFSVLDEACHPYQATFADQSVNAVGWDWDFNDGFSSTQQHPSHLFVNPSLVPLTFNVELTAENVEGCVDDTIVAVTVNPKPTSSFTIDDSPACDGEQVLIHNNSILNDINYWRFGASGFPSIFNTSLIDTVFYNFNPNPQVFDIFLIVENTYGCRDTSDNEMTVYPAVDAQFVGLDEGCSPFEVAFTNASSGGQLFEWDFGDGTLSFLDEPVHVFENNTTADIIFTVTLEVTSPYSCTEMDSFDITVHPTPHPEFGALPSAQVFPDTTVFINNLTPIGPWDYEWDFGDGATSNLEQPTEHNYSTWGTYVITLLASTQFCEDTAQRTVIIEPPLPDAIFDLSIDECAPVTVDFVNESEYGVSFLWEFGDGATSSTENPVYTYQVPGTYTVRLRVVGPGGDIDSIEISNAVVVRPQPIANFIFAPTEAVVGSQPVTFLNYSQDADSYFWDFGDSTTSIEANPQKIYVEAGQFFPSLVASTNFGCRDTFVSMIPANAIIRGTIEVPNAFAPGNSGSGASIYDPYSIDNNVFFPVLTGVISDEYTFSIFNRWGELIFETHDVREGWDGYYRGKPCQQDVYVWKLRGRYVSGERFTKVGDVTLMK